jgi:hypothetical protein
MKSFIDDITASALSLIKTDIIEPVRMIKKTIPDSKRIFRLYEIIINKTVKISVTSIIYNGEKSKFKVVKRAEVKVKDIKTVSRISAAVPRFGFFIGQPPERF